VFVACAGRVGIWLFPLNPGLRRVPPTRLFNLEYMKLINKKNMTVLTVLGGVMMPSMSWACACGCGVFDVGGSTMLPTGPGGMVYVQYDWQNQDHNWSGTSQAPSANNGDKDIKTDFMMVGAQYMFNQSWGAQIEIPDDYRIFTTLGGANGTTPTTLKWNALGDIRVHAIYTGFAEDLSSGLDFGLKLPTGDFTHNDQYGDIDRDSEIGTGSTDVLLGGFHRGNIAQSQSWEYPSDRCISRRWRKSSYPIAGATVDPRLRAAWMIPTRRMYWASRTPAMAASCFHRELRFTFIPS